jgi:hypothetical protein
VRRYIKIRKPVKKALIEKKNIVRKIAVMIKIENPTLRTVLKLNSSHLIMANAIRKMKNKRHKIK